VKDDESRRQIARRARRDAGDRTASLANALMKLRDATLANLELEQDVRDAILRARAVQSNQARRRAERTLAGDLRRLEDSDLDAIEQRLASTSDTVETQVFHDAERWRTRLIEDDAALAEFGADDELPPLIAKARSERDTGKPPGAARALFRHITAVLKARA